MNRKRQMKKKPVTYRWLIRALRSPELRAEYDAGRLPVRKVQRESVNREA